jgi:hypothetical protein
MAQGNQARVDWQEARMYYQTAIREIDPTVDAAAVEVWMRLQYSTLDHLSHEVFVREVALYRMAKLSAKQVARLKNSFGL